MKRLVAALGVLGLLGLGLAACSSGPSGPYTIPSTVPADCTKPVTTAATLADVLNALPDNSTVELGKGACYLIQGTLTLQGKTGVTVDGNGATVKLAGPVPSFNPIVNLFGDTNLTVKDLTLVGTFNGSNGGGGVEGDYGVAMESNNGVTVTNTTIENVQGDWLYLEPPYDTHEGVNKAITFDHDTFLNAGYHGITIESVDGLNVTNSTMTNMGVDAIDAEVDVATSDFVNGVCVDFCQNNVAITNNVWTNWTSDWFASLEGQGIQENDLTLSGNTFATTGIFMEVDQNPAYAKNWHIELNAYGPGAYAFAYHGGGSADMQLQGVTDVFMTRNHMPDCPGENAPTCDGSLIHYAIQAFGLSGTIAGNDLTGNLGVIQPGGTGNAIGLCWNRIGPTASTSLDAPCR